VVLVGELAQPAGPERQREREREPVAVDGLRGAGRVAGEERGLRVVDAAIGRARPGPMHERFREERAAIGDAEACALDGERAAWPVSLG
jgi:hypothetical protein